MHEIDRVAKIVAKKQPLLGHKMELGIQVRLVVSPPYTSVPITEAILSLKSPAVGTEPHILSPEN